MNIELKKPIRIAGKMMSVGDQAEVPRKTGRVLVAIGRAVEVTKAEDEAPEDPVAEEKPRKYKRRDMTAEK